MFFYLRQVFSPITLLTKYNLTHYSVCVCLGENVLQFYILTQSNQNTWTVKSIYEMTYITNNNFITFSVTIWSSNATFWPSHSSALALATTISPAYIIELSQINNTYMVKSNITITSCYIITIGISNYGWTDLWCCLLFQLWLFLDNSCIWLLQVWQLIS